MFVSSTSRRAEGTRIDLRNEHKVLHWAKRLRVNRQELRRAVELVGDSPAAVERQLEARRADARGLQDV